MIPTEQVRDAPGAGTRSELIKVAKRGPMFRSELRAKVRDGTKTMTRRIVKPQPPEGWELGTSTTDGCVAWQDPVIQDGVVHWIEIRPRYTPGQILYMPEPLVKVVHGACAFAAYADDDEIVRLPSGAPLAWRWQRDYLTSMQMPREAARTFLRITETKAGWVQKITEDDAEAEGAIMYYDGEYRQDRRCPTYREGFHALWDSIHGPGAWERNDWTFAHRWELVEMDDG